MKSSPSRLTRPIPLQRRSWGGVIENDVTPAALDEVNIKQMAEKYRMQSVIFKVATRIFVAEKYKWKGNQYDFLAQLLKLTEDFINSDKIKIKGDHFSKGLHRKILLTLNVTRIIQHFMVAIKAQNAELLSPVFDKEKPIKSTGDMPAWWTSKENTWFEKTHINHTVHDSTWESNNAKIINKHEAVKSFVKNDHLGFVIKYNFNGVIKNYYPDYIIALNNGDFLVLEVKGWDNDDNRAKREYLNLWVKAVNQNGKFGKWHWAVVFNSYEIHDILNKYQEFPVDPFLPLEEPQKEEFIDKSGDELASFYGISAKELKKEQSVNKMIQKVIKALITEHIENIFTVIKEALGTVGEHFIDEEEVQDQIYQLLDGLTPPNKAVFENRVRSSITDAKFLKKQSLDYLIHAEYLNDMIKTQMLDDFSPYVLQMSRAVESELLNWVFIPFTNFIRTEHPNIRDAYSKDLHHKDMKLFASKLNAGDKIYTLGNMHFILRKTANAYVRGSSELASDFHYYLSENFSQEIFSGDFLDEVNNLLKNFRNKSAHTDKLTKEHAQDCRHLVRKILLRFLKIVK